MNNRSKGALWLSLFCWIYPLPSRAQNSPANSASTPTATIIKSIDLQTGEVLKVKIPQLPANASGNIAVILGDTDITSQVEIKGNELIYRSSLVPLNIGAQTLTVFQKSPNRWQPLAKVQVNVRAGVAQAPISSGNSGVTPTATPTPVISTTTPTPANSTPTPAPDSSTPTPAESTTPTPAPSDGSQPTPDSPTPAPEGATPAPTDGATPAPEGATPTPATAPTPADVFTPKVAINVKSQILENRSADAGNADRPTFFDLDFTGGLSTEHQLSESIKLKTKFTIVGTTFQPEALRFGELQNRASQIDLSEYAIELNENSNQFAIGHLCFGNHPFLLSNLCTRGLSSKVKINDTADLSVGKISSTAIVGFDNILGIDRSENSLESIALGLQVARNASGGVRLETTWMNGARSAVNNFNVGEVIDAEKSQGIGFRLLGNDDAGRLKTDAGFANSTFTAAAANDPELNDGLNAVLLDSVTKNAWYAEASYDLLKDIKLGGDRTLSAAMNFRTERIDPQFASIGAPLQADLQQTQYALNLNIAGATIQFQQNFSDDNIANLPNLLKTNNRNTNFNLSLPLQTVLQDKNSLLPTVTYGSQNTHQIGAITALVGSGFNNPGQIPDQNNTTNRVGLDWNIGTVNFNYQFINAFQDNRQLGQETNDTRNLTHQLASNWQVTPQFRLNLGYNFVRADNLGQAITRFTNSPTLGASWEFNPGTTFALNYNRNDDNDSIGQTFNRGESLEFLLSHNFQLNSLGRDVAGSAFLRFGKQSTLNIDNPNGVNTNAAIDTLSAGLSLSF